MDGRREDRLVRTLVGSSARRALLGRFAMSGLAALPLLSSPAVAAKGKKKRRKKRCPSPPVPPALPTCSGSCPATCLLCFPRPDAPPLCGDGRQVLCAPCASDLDCVGTDQPYCTTQRTEVATGVARRWDDICPPYQVGICTRILDCNDI
jgi:hypothetical protein